MINNSNRLYLLALICAVLIGYVTGLGRGVIIVSEDCDTFNAFRTDKGVYECKKRGLP